MKGSRTRGAVELSKLAVPQREIARRVRRSQQAVSHWMTGRYRPGGDERGALEREFGISHEAWEEFLGQAVALQVT